MPGLYFGFDSEPIDREQWCRLLEDTAARTVARTEVTDDIMVSTVWIGLDYRFSGDGPPLIFETMIFGGAHDNDVWRYPNRDAARAGHDQAVALARGDRR